MASVKMAINILEGNFKRIKFLEIRESQMKTWFFNPYVPTLPIIWIMENAAKISALINQKLINFNFPLIEINFSQTKIN